MARAIQSYPWILILEWVCIAYCIDRLLSVWQPALPSSAHAFERVHYRSVMVIPIAIASFYSFNHGVHMGFE
jgi:hypothetical protein